MTVDIYIYVFGSGPDDLILPDVLNFELAFKKCKMFPIDSLYVRLVAGIVPANGPAAV
jgi:hypothetical protein